MTGPLCAAQGAFFAMIKKFLSGAWEVISHVAIYLAFVALLALIWGALTDPDFFDKTEYPQDYEAILTIDDKPIFCIVTLDKSDEYVEYAHGERTKRITVYTITNVSLPYGHSKSVEAKYDKENNTATVSLGEWGNSYKLTLKGPADSTSYDVLKNEIVSNYGEFCGSKESDKYHLPKCKYAKNIGPENLVYFASQNEAEALGYTFCATCADRY